MNQFGDLLEKVTLKYLKKKEGVLNNFIMQKRRKKFILKSIFSSGR